MRYIVIALLLFACLTAPVSAGDDAYLHFVGNVTQLREYRDLSGTLTRRELWLTVLTSTGVKTFQFRCPPSMTTPGCHDESLPPWDSAPLLTGCSTTGIGGSNEVETYSGFACTSGVGRCREITGQADRREGDGQIIYDLALNLSVSGCAAK